MYGVGVGFDAGRNGDVRADGLPLDALLGELPAKLGALAVGVPFAFATAALLVEL